MMSQMFQLNGQWYAVNDNSVATIQKIANFTGTIQQLMARYPELKISQVTTNGFNTFVRRLN